MRNGFNSIILTEYRGSYRPVTDGAVSEDPLRFPGYQRQLRRAMERTGGTESVEWGVVGTEKGPCVVVAFDFNFLGGSMGEATGRRLVAAIKYAQSADMPLVTEIATGGARVQEGMRALMQMHAVAAALVDLRGRGIPHIAIARNPTTGGVWASVGAVADIIIATEDAVVAFAGRRVRGDPTDSKAFKTSGKYDAGAVDVVVRESQVREVLLRYLGVCGRVARHRGTGKYCDLPTVPPAAAVSGAGWRIVELARAETRPRAPEYLGEYFEEMVDLSGDRINGRDPNLRTGVGLRFGDPIAFIAQMGKPNSPAGFRTAVRVLRLAERWQIPLLTLIDTPGAQHDAEAESQGIGTAIAETFAAFADASVPVTSVLIGEGCSGGALAIADTSNLWAVPSSYFSVIRPEAAASILYGDPTHTPEVANALKIAPGDLLRLCVVRGIAGPRAHVEESPQVDRCIGSGL